MSGMTYSYALEHRLFIGCYPTAMVAMRQGDLHARRSGRDKMWIRRSDGEVRIVHVLDVGHRTQSIA